MSADGMLLHKDSPVAQSEETTSPAPAEAEQAATHTARGLFTLPDQPTGVVLGATGLLGITLTDTLRKAGWNVVTPGRGDLDLFDDNALAACMDAHEPSVVFNTVAYTQVDRAEDEPDEARRLNKCLPALLGRVLRSRPVRCLQLSTDFVFNGKHDVPYTTEDEPDPQSVYGKTKLDGEKALLDALGEQALVARTAWLFGPGRKNFIHTILGACQEKTSLNVVHDQTGSPTYTVDLARMCLALVSHPKAQGIYHLVNSGQASWCELAAEAATLAEVSCAINAIPSSAYPQKAPRPAYSVLDTSRFTNLTGMVPRPWIQAVRDYVFHDLWSSGLFSHAADH